MANSYDNLRQLILLEEFKNSVYPGVKTYINEQKADTLDKAARMADDYTLLHKLSFNKSSQQTSYKKPFYSTTSNKPLNIAPINIHFILQVVLFKLRNQNLQGRLLFLLVVIVRKKVTFYLIVIYLNADKSAKHRQHCPQLSQY